MSIEDCIFCKIIKKEINADIVFENNHCIAFKDINPAAPHHYLVIPKQHFESIAKLEAQAASNLILAIQEVAKKLSIESFRTVFNTGKDSGQSVFHVHAHLLAGRELNWPPG